MTLTTATIDVREAAVDALVASARRERAGQDVTDHYRTDVQPALNAAHAAGYTDADIHAAADRRYGLWLIDNSRQAA
jgi:hypothetical protein